MAKRRLSRNVEEGMFIRNMDELVSHGNREGRRLALEILEAGFQAADTYQAIRRLVRVEGHTLRVGGYPELDVSGWGDLEINLNEVEHIYVIGAGKAVQKQAQALEDILGERLTGGAVTVKRGEGAYLKKIEVTEGAHPVPDENSMVGARKIVDIAQRAGERDLVFTLFSDGASALFPLPAEGFSLENVQAVYRLTIKYGPQTIIHRVMRYFSAVNCGRIIKMIRPARAINMIMQTGPFPRWRKQLPEEGAWVHSWPPPKRNYVQDVRSMQQEAWWRDVPSAMREALERFDPRYDVPDLEEFRNWDHHYWQPVGAEDVLRAMQRKAEELGLKGVILGNFPLVQSSEAAKILVGMARHSAAYGEPFEPPVALLSGGELMVPVGNATGIGGRNQEFVLSAATMLNESFGAHVVIASADSDGTDGPGTQYRSGPAGFVCQAGGVIDGETLPAARRASIDLEAELLNHNASIPLWKLGSGIVTGNTGTALGDMRVVLVLGRSHSRAASEAEG